eukprot:scaffold542744_cov20-Prasinocladus_malaysianus.AAC.2
MKFAHCPKDTDPGDLSENCCDEMSPAAAIWCCVSGDAAYLRQLLLGVQDVFHERPLPVPGE